MHLEGVMRKATIQGELYVTVMQEITVIYMIYVFDVRCGTNRPASP